MNEKALIATEPKSSRTTRYHPEFIGELLSKCNTTQLDVALKSLFKIGSQYQDKGFLDVRGRVLLTWANTIIANASCPRLTREGSTPVPEDLTPVETFTATIESTPLIHEYEFFFQGLRWREVSRLGFLSVSVPLNTGDKIVIDDLRYEVVEIEHKAHRKDEKVEPQQPQVFLRML